MLRALINRRHYRQREVVWLEITPPHTVARTPEATEQLFAVVHNLRSARGFGDKLLGREPVVSFEITSTKKDGVRFMVQVAQEDVMLLEKAIASYVPDATVRRVAVPSVDYEAVRELKLRSHYSLPLLSPDAFAKHDPLAYVTNALTKLHDEELVTVQLVVKPIRIRETATTAHKILRHEEVLARTGKGGSAWSGVTRGINTALLQTTELVGEAYSGTAYGAYSTKATVQQAAQRQQVLQGQRPARTLSSFEQQILESMHHKAMQPQFQVSFRVLARGERAHSHVEVVCAALGGFTTPLYQELKSKRQLTLLQRRRLLLGKGRLPALFRRHAMILSTTELAALYHFPARSISQTDNLVTSLSRTLPAPVSLKSDQKLAIMIGENHHRGVVTPIGLTEAERERHMYVLGGTGNGKTTMLFYQILQDIRHGNGVAVLDPHGDLAERILRYIPDERVQDVIYLNPDDLSHPVGINLLEVDPALTGDDLLREKDMITEATISVLRKVFSEDDSGGHRIEYVLRNTIQTALTLESPTLFTIFELLNDAKFRRSITKDLTDKHLKDFWTNEIGKAGDMQKVKMAAGITAKIGRFLFSASARRMLEQPKSTIDFDEILSSKKILICNFSKGLVGEDTSALFGTTVLAKLQTAALRRARIAQGERSPYFLYVDEFQNFATMSFVQMLSEARKYKLFLTMAEQSTAQQAQQRLVDIILANVGTVVCFRSGSPADERLVLPLFTPCIEQGEIANLPAYSYYVRIAAVRAQEPMSGVTVVVDDEGSQLMAERVIRSSRELYGRKEVMEEIAGNVETQAPQQTKRSILAKPAKATRTKKARSRKRDELSELRTQE